LRNECFWSTSQSARLDIEWDFNLCKMLISVSVWLGNELTSHFAILSQIIMEFVEFFLGKVTVYFFSIFGSENVSVRYIKRFNWIFLSMENTN
jgi:hypothetical protein